MAFVITSGEGFRTQQGARNLGAVNTGNYFGRDCIIAITGNNPLHDRSPFRQAITQQATSTFKIGDNQEGRSINYHNTTDDSLITAHQVGAMLDPISAYLVVVNPTGAPQAFGGYWINARDTSENNRRYLYRGGSAATADRLYVGMNASSSQDTGIDVPIRGRPYACAVSHDQAGTWKVAVDGVSSSSGAVTADANAPTVFGIGGYSGDTTSSNWRPHSEITFAAAFAMDRQWSEEELLALTAEPYQIFDQPVRRTYFMPGSAGGGGGFQSAWARGSNAVIQTGRAA